MLEILKETTVWSDGSNANHTYLLDGSKIIAYAKYSDNSVQVLRTQIKIDKRYRTFIKTKHFGLENIIKSSPTKSNIRVFKVKSKEKEYSLTSPGEVSILFDWIGCNQTSISVVDST